MAHSRSGSDEPKPEADVVEQGRSMHEDGDDLRSVHGDPESPEADVLDQQRLVSPGPADGAGARAADPEVPEADAAEQARELDADDEFRSD